MHILHEGFPGEYVLPKMVCREVVIFSRKMLNIRVERTGRSRQADGDKDVAWSRARTN